MVGNYLILFIFPMFYYENFERAEKLRLIINVPTMQHSLSNHSFSVHVSMCLSIFSSFSCFP